MYYHFQAPAMTRETFPKETPPVTWMAKMLTSLSNIMFFQCLLLFLAALLSQKYCTEYS